MITVDEKSLERLLSDIEKAAWARSWRELQLARKALVEYTGVDISFQIRKALDGRKT